MRTLLLCTLGLVSFAPVPSVALVTPGPSARVAGQVPDERAALVAHFNLDKKNVALQGYDPVAYFHEGGSRPTKGKPEFALEHGGVTYHFVVALHREMFRRTPTRYEPAYGGWCAYAIAKSGEKVEVDPKAFVIQQGRLLLFYKSLFNDTRKSWIKEPGELLEQAGSAWRELTKEPFVPYAGLENVDAGGLALEGYDPVSYFDADGKAPVRGDAQWTHEHAGATYHFANQKNRDQFSATPAAFAPAYGGWCAYGFAMKNGLWFVVDPTSFRVQDGRLLLFTHTSDMDARNIWDMDPANLQMLADANWEAQRGRP